MPTTMCEGIEFRSRTEAAWYLVFKDYGLKPVYEPETFEIATIGDKDEPNHKSCWYMPDFAITIPSDRWCMNVLHGHWRRQYGYHPFDGCKRIMVEIKAGVDGETEDIAKACVLGYQIPTLVIVGWPITYSAIVFHERCKGNPSGYRIFFGAPDVLFHDEVRLGCSYPDENWLEIYQEDLEHFTAQSEPRLDTTAYQIARNSWNRTKWNPFPKS